MDLTCEYEHRLGRPSTRTAAIGVQFGVPLFPGRETVVCNARVTLGPGRIVLLLGPSGSGKSSALAQIERRFATACCVDRVSFPEESAVVDGVAPDAALKDAVGLLTACGLGEARLWVRRYEELSEGERFRARLALAAARVYRAGGVAPLLCDEFCSALHRRAARAISYGLRKLAFRHKLCVVVASSNEDILGDLQPDVVVRFAGGGRCRVEPRTVRAGKPISLRRRLRLERGTKRDYAAFSAMHYRATDELGFVHKVFVLREGRGGELLGMIVYSHAPLELALRNRATDRWFSRNPARVNRYLRIIRRLIIHPDVRGCGLGHFLVRKTLPLAGTRFVECLASMGAFNPVFERAGMTRIGQYELPSKRRAVLDELASMDVDPTSRAFAVDVGRRPRVRRIVAGVVREWYAGTTGGGERRVARQSPRLLAQLFRGLIGSRPMYYLWQRGKRGAV